MRKYVPYTFSSRPISIDTIDINIHLHIANGIYQRENKMCTQNKRINHNILGYFSQFNEKLGNNSVMTDQIVCVRIYVSESALTIGHRLLSDDLFATMPCWCRCCRCRHYT